ncbi:MAG: DNA mismatch endonuclease Vsr [Hyphomicrobiaceae bacterium]|nr:DNA mismatch endonuclease Vsr [Hyphomicrobiaceae bacterium]
MDHLTPTERSENMRRIRGRDSGPELVVRRLLHKSGYRYRLHRNDLPGRPDIVFPSRRKVIFVHGCFWHRHRGCKYAYTPKSRTQFWEDKFAQNVKRDARAEADLRDRGWETMTVWECETRDASLLLIRLVNFLGDA